MNLPFTHKLLTTEETNNVIYFITPSLQSTHRELDTGYLPVPHLKNITEVIATNRPLRPGHSTYLHLYKL